MKLFLFLFIIFGPGLDHFIYYQSTKNRPKIYNVNPRSTSGSGPYLRRWKVSTLYIKNLSFKQDYIVLFSLLSAAPKPCSPKSGTVTSSYSISGWLGSSILQLWWLFHLYLSSLSLVRFLSFLLFFSFFLHLTSSIFQEVGVSPPRDWRKMLTHRLVQKSKSPFLPLYSSKH